MQEFNINNICKTYILDSIILYGLAFIFLLFEKAKAL